VPIKGKAQELMRKLAARVEALRDKALDAGEERAVPAFVKQTTEFFGKQMSPKLQWATKRVSTSGRRGFTPMWVNAPSHRPGGC